MNEDKMLVTLSNFDDDLIEKEIENLVEGVECDIDSIKRKACQKLINHNIKLAKENKKMKFKNRLRYVAAICVCFIGVNVVYADEISEVLKSFLNKTPVYSTTVDGDAYYLKESKLLDDSMEINSFIVCEGRLEMEFTSKLGIDVLEDIKIIPQDAPDMQYVMGGYSKDDNHKYMFSFANGKEKNYNIKPFQAFDLVVGDKTYSVTLDKAKSVNDIQRLAAGQATNSIDMVNVGANSIEKDGKQAVQLLASFNNKDMKLSAFGQPVTTTIEATFENLGKEGLVSHETGAGTQDIYATDGSGNKYKLEVPDDANAFPVTTFETEASKDTELTINLPALLATYQKSVDNFKINIPEEGEEIIDRNIDMVAQQAVVKSIKRLSPTSAELVWQLNTGDENHISIKSFQVYSKNIKKISSEFSDNAAVMTLEFDKNVEVADLEISWPEFVMNGNWTINMK